MHKYLIYILFFLLPFSTRYIFEETIYSLYGLDLIFIIILISFLFNRKKNKIIDKNILILMGFFWIVNFFNLYWSNDKELSGYYLLRLTEGLVLAYIILKTKLDLKKIAWIWIISGTLQSILGIIQFAYQKTWALKWLGMTEHLPENLGTQVIAGNFGRMLRAYGTFPHPNILGMFLVIAILFCVYLYLKKENKYLLLSSLTILSTGLILTLSRQAWLGLILGLLIILVLYRPKKNIAKLISLIFLVGIIFSLIYPQLVLNRFDVNQRLEKYSLQERYDQYGNSADVLKKYWPVGLGLGNYTKYFNEPVHNIYILIFSELGIFGLLSFLMIMGYSIYCWLKNPKNFLGVLIIVLLFLGLFDHYLITTAPFNLILWLIIALFYNSSKIDQSSKTC